MMAVVAEFFANEFNEHVRATLQRELRAGRQAYLTFNVFNVRIDPDQALAVIEDELDPNREEAVPLDEFGRMVDEQPL